MTQSSRVHKVDAVRLINKRILTLRSVNMAILRSNMIDYRSNDSEQAVGELNRPLRPLEQDLLENTFRIDELYRLLSAIEDDQYDDTDRTKGDEDK